MLSPRSAPSARERARRNRETDNGYRRRMAYYMIAARCLNAGVMGMVVTASTSMMYEMVKHGRGAARQDTSQHALVQRFSTNLSTVATLATFLTGPLVGAFLDSVGRLPSMVIALMLSGLARVSVATRPSFTLYFAYRVMISVSTPAFINAITAALGDLYGRGSEDLLEVSMWSSRFVLPSLVIGTSIGSRFKRPRQVFLACGLSQMAIASFLAIACKETIHRRSGVNSLSLELLNPLACIKTYRRSAALTALAILSTCRELPGYMSVDAVYNRQRFPAWGTRQESTQLIVAQLCAFGSTFVTQRLIRRFGHRGATSLQAVTEAAALMATAFAPRMFLLYAVPLLSLVQCGCASVQQALQWEASIQGVGQGELSSAEVNRTFLPSLVMPHFFTGVYVRFAEKLPALPYLLAAAMHIAIAGVAVPEAFSRLNPEAPQRQ